LARRPGPIVSFIAETGGQNAMIVDSSALAEQVVADVLASAFDSAGQRCSAARLLYVQADIADRLLGMLAGAMAELAIGDPGRIDETVRHILARLKVGNSYINRSMIGAVVGVQPFGGEGLSGTGPKAGGPRYLHRFATERTISTDTTAAGGNATLLSLQEEI